MEVEGVKLVAWKAVDPDTGKMSSVRFAIRPVVSWAATAIKLD